MTVLAAIAMLGASAPVAPTIEDVIQTGFRDATFEVKVTQKDQAELAKINRSFGDAYRFSSMKAFAKEPMMLRLESKVGDSDVLFILNGFNRLMRVPRANFNQRENLKDSPAKVQSLLDFGIITPSLMKNLYAAAYVRTDRATGEYVFDVTYQSRFDDKTRYRIWVDPVKKYTTKREWFSRQGPQKATFIYSEPEGKNGVWMPTHVVVRNVDNKVAGVTDYVSAKFNVGLSDSMFKL